MYVKIEHIKVIQAYCFDCFVGDSFSAYFFTDHFEF